MSELLRFLPDKRRRKARLRIPESHALYACPQACGRRQGIRLLMNDDAEHASFLTFSQVDIALGSYVEQMERAIERVVSQVRPRVLTIYVNCVDDFLGTDFDALLADLSARYRTVRFLLSRINPVSEDVRSVSVAASAQRGLYAALEPSDVRDAGVNVVGSYVPVPAECEFGEVLASCGAGPVRQLPGCGTFDEYARMADSSLTVSLSHVGDAPAADMEARLGIPWTRWHACYDLDEIERRYGALAAALGAPSPSCAPWRAQAADAVECARVAVGARPIVVDTSASFMPFSLASALLRYGFDVRAVFALHTKGCDDDAERTLALEHPGVRVFRQTDCRVDRDFGIPSESVAIGCDGAFLTSARRVVDLYHDEGCFGFQGVVRLMGLLADAASGTEA